MRKKTELYKKEQDDIIEKLIQLLGLDDQKSTTLYELDNNKEKTDAIMKMIPTIRKFFSSWIYKGENLRFKSSRV